MTLPEVLLWQQIRKDELGYRIRRQASFGDYIVGFYCANPKVAIEVDGAIHESRTEHDRIRDVWLNSQGILVLRIPAYIVLRSPESAALLVKEFLELHSTKNL